MNRSRLIQMVAAAILSLPTGYAFVLYAGEAQQLGRAESVAGNPKPVPVAEKPAPEEAKPEVPAKSDEKQPEDKKSDGTKRKEGKQSNDDSSEAAAKSDDRKAD